MTQAEMKAKAEEAKMRMWRSMGEMFARKHGLEGEERATFLAAVEAAPHAHVKGKSMTAIDLEAVGLQAIGR